MKKVWTCVLALWACSVSGAKDFAPTVGMRVLQSGDMPITVVYPAREPARHHTLGPFEIDVAMDAPPIAGNLRLIVLSHGTASHALPDFALAASLARAGFVVAQPRHRGDNYLDADKAGPEAWVTRPKEVSETIDRVLADPALGAVTDHQRVGVHGMSAGGATALTMAGGRWRTLSLVQHCNAHWDEDVGFCANSLAEKPQELAERRKRMERLRSAPSEQFLPRNLTDWHGGAATQGATDARPDPRVQAVSVSVPVAAIFDEKSLAALAVPVGVVMADADQVLVPRYHAAYLLAHCPSCTTLYTLKGAGHFDLLSPWPESVARSVAAQQMRGGLPTPQVTDALRQEAFDSIVRFYQRYLP